MAARKLRRRSVRDREGAFVVEGRLVVQELLRSDLEISEMFVAEGEPELRDLGALGEARGARVAEVPEAIIKAVADTTTPQGVVAIARPRDTAIRAEASLVLVLADVRDPGNAGTLVRSAHAAGVDLVVFGRGGVDPLHPKTVRATAGALFHVPVVRDLEPVEALDALRGFGIRTIGTTATASTGYDRVDLAARVAIVVGNEAWGLPDELSNHLDHVVSIPMPGPMESLNVAVAGSILLFEAVRQRRDG